MNKKIKFEWEIILPGTRRVKVIGGWIINTWESASESMAFIPDPNHEWEIDKEENG